MPKPSTTSVKLDGEIKERVQCLAASRRRTPHWVMREAIEQYVEREQFRQDALAAWNHYQTTGLHATAEEADAWLAKLEAGKDAAPPKCRKRNLSSPMNVKPPVSTNRPSTGGVPTRETVVRTSDHWGELGTSTYTLGLTDEQMIAMGGYKVPSEPNLWLFKKPVSGYVYYKDMIVKATGKPLRP